MSQSEDDPTGRFSVRIADPELAAAIEDRAEEQGSKSAVMRNGLRESILSPRSDVDADDHTGDVPLKAAEGHRKLVEYVGVGGHIELEAAESILANHLNIKTTSVRQVVIRPLVAADWLARQTGVYNVAIVVRDPDAETREPADDVLDELEANAEPDVPTDADDVDTAGDRLDELAAAGEEVDDGE